MAAKTDPSDSPAAAPIVLEERVKQSLELITRRLPQENISRLDVIEDLLRQGKAPLCLWGTEYSASCSIAFSSSWLWLLTRKLKRISYLADGKTQVHPTLVAATTTNPRHCRCLWGHKRDFCELIRIDLDSAYRILDSYVKVC
jgi:hypothetical protein